MTPGERWQRYLDDLWVHDELGLEVDVSRMAFEDDWLTAMEPRMQRAFAAMAELEAGAIANRDEGRMVGHYWLRAPHLAPDPGLRSAIEEMGRAVRGFAGRILHEKGDGRFTDCLLIGIGGSALGPQLVADALGDRGRPGLAIHVLDNTDPDGMARTLALLRARLDRVLCIVISKSGGTPETRNGMLFARAAYEARGLDFARHAVAITMEGSQLDLVAAEENWLARFPMWDWVGGRTSVMSAVGLVPATLQGVEVDALLAGAAACDAATRIPRTRENPAALLALMWRRATHEAGRRAMVVLPYKDRLALLARYLQQLVMESLGKGSDEAGRPVEAGLTVYGNKGSTDQHAYLQQLREGRNDFFVTFVEVREREPEDIEVLPGVTAGDYLRALLLGTREALSDNGRESITLSIARVDARSLGALIALFERAVGLYAFLIGINAYHQPGVEAGKRAADRILEIQRQAAGCAPGPPSPAEAERIARLIAPLLRVSDLTDPALLAGRLRDAPDAVSAWLRGRLAPSTCEQIDAWRGPQAPSRSLLELLVADLNEILGGPGLYDAERFAGVPLTRDLLALLDSRPQGGDRRRLHRLLLERAYPGAVREARPADLVEMVYRVLR